ncbi:S-adenosyl-L-methionine-dependent methyltransferase-like [Lasallia pustulata]|uniref:S-adenosyl-L-methionine-dependent methyltransferase-like n=1 Tax=Lasallia pustulata TaxID=136370 RepID=A0A1W5CRI6_9LECA|nr:S-adenosyl-L-methionine-dependent methyltransferase-like [Lasallia pustulata]
MAQVVLEVDEHLSQDNDIRGLDSKSLSASVLDYEYENGRRYHGYKAGHYPIPNDESELDRLDLQHHLLTTLLDGKLHLAPLKDPKKILDLGTGTGIWAIDMADLYPDAIVIGTDLSPVQPQWVPDNVHFAIEDVESDWTYTEDSFDYIHIRLLIGAISDWSSLIRKAYSHLRPGGYVEVQEIDPRMTSDDDSLHPDNISSVWSTLICEASENYGRPIPRATEYKYWLEEAGFAEIRETIYKRPTNTWPKNKQLKEVGKFQLVNYTEGLEGLSVGLFTRGLQWQPAEVQVLVAKVKTELKNKNIHSYQNLAVVYGRKPETAPPSRGAKSGRRSLPASRPADKTASGAKSNASTGKPNTSGS